MPNSDETLLAAWPHAATRTFLNRLPLGMRFDFLQNVLQVAFVPHTLARALVSILLIFAVGGHWLTLQSLAWAGMFAKFSQSYSITEALVKTFNGKNPCKLCIAVEQGKKSEQTRDSVKVETKLELFLLNRNAIMVRPAIGSFQFGRSSSVLALERFERPPTPPPRYV